MTNERFTFDDITLDAGERRVVRQGAQVALSPKAHDLFVYLVRHAGRLVTKRELLDAIWPETHVEEGILTVHISSIRKALGDDSRTPRYIETVAKSGYRFVGSIAGRFEPVTPDAPGAEVHEMVGRARALLMSSRRSEIPKAIEGFETALRLNARHAPAHAGLALAHCAFAELRLGLPADAFPQARASALRALALDDRCADAWTALGAVMCLHEWDWIGAERSLQRALAVSPAHTQARLLYGRLLDAQGRFDDGLAMKLGALELEPFSPAVHLSIALSYWNQRRFDESLEWANKTLELDPAHGLAREFLAGAYWALGDFDRHMEENVRHAALHGMPASALDELRQTYAAGGRAAVVRLALAQAARQPAAFPPMQLALMHGELGDLDRALPCLELAIEARDPCLVDLAVAPQWDALRADKRFRQCLEKMRLN